MIRKDYAGGAYSTCTYDNTGRLTNISDLKSDSTIIYTQQNTFDNVGNILTKTTGLGTTIYSYDQTYQLTSSDHPVQVDETFTYDPVGNRLASADNNDWTYNNRNELTSYNAVTYSYDSNGNIISKTDGAGTTRYTYNYENKLIRVDFPDGSYAEYKYDIRGRRIEKDVDGNVTNFLYDGNHLLAEYDSSETLIRNYLYKLGQFNPIILKENGLVYFYLKDHIYTPYKLIDESGKIVWSGRYKSFGEDIIQVEIIENNIRFPGQYLDIESNLYYNLMRYYNPYDGRYCTQDPIKTKKGSNYYVYAQNNSINFIDPTGEVAITGAAILACLAHPLCRAAVGCLADVTVDVTFGTITDLFMDEFSVCKTLGCTSICACLEGGIILGSAGVGGAIPALFGIIPMTSLEAIGIPTSIIGLPKFACNKLCAEIMCNEEKEEMERCKGQMPRPKP